MSGISAVELRPGHWISTIVKGYCWPLGPLPRRASADTLADMVASIDAGMTTIDGGDTDPSLERLIGSFLQDIHQTHGSAVADSIRVHSKLTPDLSMPHAFGPRVIEDEIDQSLTRLGVEALDLVQLHWPGQDMTACLDGLGYLSMMQAKGKVHHIGVADFNTDQLRLMLQSGVNLAAAQVSFSLIDQRPKGAFAEVCRQHDIALLAYGTLAGGFLSRRWLGAPDPGYEFASPDITRHRLIIEAFGGWALFQELLLVLDTIARRHAVTLSSIALRAIYDHADVTAVILRSAPADHIAGLLKAFQFSPTERDREALARVLSQRSGPTGPIFQLEREKLARL